MPVQRFGVAWRLSATTALLTFGLIVLGSIVRTTGSGLACPDWPLCEGRLIPRFEMHVMVEWLHRLVAMLVSLGFAATAVWILVSRELRARLGGLVALGAALLVVQVVLGALTVWKLLHPAVVSSHLAVALLFFGTLVSIALAARAHSRPATRHGTRPAGLLGECGLVTAFVCAQAVLGAVVSTSHAGLACPDWPACNGAWLPPLASLEGLQMLHRYAAYALIAALVGVALRARAATDPGVRAGAALAVGLVLAQAMLGVASVWLALPVWMVALHLATATALFATTLITSIRVAALASEGRRVTAAARA